MESIQSKTVSKGELNSLVKDLSSFDYMILERKLVIDRDKYISFSHFSLVEDFSIWDWGRLFSKSLELRWIRDEKGFRVVLTGQYKEVLSHYKTLEYLEERDTDYYLWGEKTQGKTDEWRELRIPRILKYPVEGQKKRIKILVKEYYNPETGELEFYRFKGIKEEEDA